MEAGSEEGLLQSSSALSGELGRERSISWILVASIFRLQIHKGGRRDSHSDAKQVRAGSAQSGDQLDKICGSISAHKVSSQPVS